MLSVINAKNKYKSILINIMKKIKKYILNIIFSLINSVAYNYIIYIYLPYMKKKVAY